MRFIPLNVYILSLWPVLPLQAQCCSFLNMFNLAIELCQEISIPDQYVYIEGGENDNVPLPGLELTIPRS